MALTKISSSRESDMPNVLIIDIDLMEFRFAKAPTVPSAKSPMQASTGAVNSQNQRVIADVFRPVLEATQQLNNAQIISYSGQAVGFIRGALGV